MNRISKIILLQILFFSCLLKAQSTTTPEIKVLARVTLSGKVLIRWAPNTHVAYRKLSKHGYRVKRYTIVSGGKILAKPLEKDLGVFKPALPDVWKKIIEENDNAAIVAQSLFGDDFEVNTSNSIESIINLSEAQEQRFTWGLYAADQDFEVAKLAGLGYEDIDVEKNGKYLYRIYPMIPDSELLVKYGYIYIGTDEYQILPKPIEIFANFSDSRVVLSWDNKTYQSEYNNYVIERSEDGLVYQKINKVPYATTNKEGKVPDRIYYIDSIKNEKKYFYRVKGKTPFGEISPPSDAVSGIAHKALKAAPKIYYNNVLDTNTVVLKWKFDKKYEKLIKGFRLNKSRKVDGVYKTVIDNISPELRSVKYNGIDASNYFIVQAIAKNGKNSLSYPVLVQPIDSFPPAKPIGLTGKVDSLGVVSLKWKPNKERDMLGYRIYRGNNKNEEYSQVTVSPHLTNEFLDTISTKMLNKNVFYRIVAVDKQYNMSEYSDILKLKKPDNSPPTSPVITYYKSFEGNVILKWANSQSIDVVKHNVYRRKQGLKKWNLIEEVPTSNKQKHTEWTDKTVKGGQDYEYMIRAEDDSQLLSIDIKPILVEVVNNVLPPPLQNIKTVVNKENGTIELFWNVYEEPNVAEIRIYKAENDQKLYLLRSISSDKVQYIDKNVKTNTTYKYLFRPIFMDGMVGKYKVVKVQF